MNPWLAFFATLLLLALVVGVALSPGNPDDCFYATGQWCKPAFGGAHG